jgi:hypothetical protein
MCGCASLLSTSPSRATPPEYRTFAHMRAPCLATLINTRTAQDAKAIASRVAEVQKAAAGLSRVSAALASQLPSK